MKYIRFGYIYLAVFFIMISIGISAFTVCIENYKHVEQKVISFDEKAIDSIFLRVTDVYGQKNQKTLSEFLSEENVLERMKAFCSILNEKYDFMEFDTQSLAIAEEKEYQDKFREDYNTPYFGLNDDVAICLNSVQIGRNAYNYFELNDCIYKGRGFNSSDFVLSDSLVPAIMGYEYDNIVNIGDELKFNYLSKDITIKVIGFFDKDTNVVINNSIYFFDRFIVIPSLEVNYLPQDPSDERFQKILYSTKNWGYIKVENGEDYYKYKTEIDNESKQLDLKYILTEGETGQYIKNISDSMKYQKLFFLVISGFILCLVSFSFLYFYVWKYKMNKNIYAIHFICGCSLTRMKSRIFAEVSIIFVLAFMINVVVNIELLGFDINYYSERAILVDSFWICLIVSTVIVICTCAILNIYFNKDNIYMSLQK